MEQVSQSSFLSGGFFRNAQEESRKGRNELGGAEGNQAAPLRLPLPDEGNNSKKASVALDSSKQPSASSKKKKPLLRSPTLDL